jgi:hypothetical protein
MPTFTGRQLNESIQRAFRKACHALRLEVGRDDDKTDLIANKITEIVKDGEHDADRICSRLLAELAKELRNSGKKT